MFWVKFDPSVGGEARKTRPAIIVSNDEAIHRLNRVLVVPLSSKTERVFDGEALVQLNGVAHKAIASQMMTAGHPRLGRWMGTISAEDMWEVENAILYQTGISI